MEAREGRMDITADDGLAPELPRSTSCHGFESRLVQGSLVELTEKEFGWYRVIF